MKFKNIKANTVEETEDKALIEQMKAYPDVYQPLEEKAKAAKEAQKEEPKEAEAPKAKK